MWWLILGMVMTVGAASVYHMPMGITIGIFLFSSWAGYKWCQENKGKLPPDE